MTTKPDAPTAPVYVLDDPHAPEFFVDEALGFFVHNGNLSITFAAARCDHSKNPGPINRVVAARVVLPASAAQALAIGLRDFLKLQGVDTGNAITSGDTLQ